MEFQERYETYRKAVEAFLDGQFRGAPRWKGLYDSMRYSLLLGGKRIRPVLVLEFARLGGLDWKLALPAACAVELVHTFSLIHDDLPCMDDSDTRRGKPANHIAYGETMAVLAGDTLQAEAYRLILESPGLEAGARADCALILSKASGAAGMAAGQVLDTLCVSETKAEVEEVHRLKTGAMIAGSCQMGAAAAGGDEAYRNAAAEYGYALGLAFQIRDDMLDVIGDAGEFGKPTGSDAQAGKRTFVDFFGLEGCAQQVAACTDQALSAAAPYDKDGFLLKLARSLMERRS